jgi:membrane-associated protease RseP (regulator of RpoE activity)
MEPGATIIDVTPESPAEQAGLQRGDIITAVDGQKLDLEHPLAELIAVHTPGDTVTLTVKSRGEEARDVTVTLDEQPGQSGQARLGVQFRPGARVNVFPGLRFGPGGSHPVTLPGGDIEGGTFIRGVAEDSPAAAAGLSARDIITAIDGEPIDKPRALVEAIAEHQPGDTLTLTIVKPAEEDPQEITVTLGEDPNEAGKAYLGVNLGGFFHIKRLEDGIKRLEDGVKRLEDGARLNKDIDPFLEPEALFDEAPFDLELGAMPFYFYEFDSPPEFDFDKFYHFEWCDEGTGSCFDNSI